jgi:dTDP-4-dehydrorhamnose reductase
MKTTVVVLGRAGMLGSMVSKYFHGLDKYNVVSLAREEFDPTVVENDMLGCAHIGGDDVWIINCIGYIKPRWQVGGRNAHYLDDPDVMALRINALFPRVLANYCVSRGWKLINISTDCVYFGKKGKYIETDFHDATDMYGRSKSLGEPPNCLTVRTSIIGPEVRNNYSLWSWFMSQKGNAIDGYVNHTWNGITTLQYAKLCEQTIDQGLYVNGLYHVYSSDVNKYELLSIINDEFGAGVGIRPTIADISIDRTLRTIFPEFLEQYHVPDTRTMVKEMRSWMI